MDGGNTTQTDGGTCTKVTRVGNDVKTCDTSLKGLIDRSHGYTFKFLHINRLRCGGNLIHWNGETCALTPSNRCHDNVLNDRVALQDNLSKSSLVDRQFHGLATNVRDSNLIFRILNGKREVTVDIGSTMGDDTIVVVYFHHITHHQRV